MSRNMKEEIDFEILIKEYISEFNEELYKAGLSFIEEQSDGSTYHKLHKIEQLSKDEGFSREDVIELFNLSIKNGDCKDSSEALNKIYYTILRSESTFKDILRVYKKI